MDEGRTYLRRVSKRLSIHLKDDAIKSFERHTNGRTRSENISVTTAFNDHDLMSKKSTRYVSIIVAALWFSGQIIYLDKESKLTVFFPENLKFF